MVGIVLKDQWVFYFNGYLFAVWVMVAFRQRGFRRRGVRTFRSSCSWLRGVASDLSIVGAMIFAAGIGVVLPGLFRRPAMLGVLRDLTVPAGDSA